MMLIKKQTDLITRKNKDSIKLIDIPDNLSERGLNGTVYLLNNNKDIAIYTKCKNP